MPARSSHFFGAGGSRVFCGTTPAARIILRTPAAKPNSNNTIMPQGEVPSQRSNNQPSPAPTNIPATNSADNRKPRASADVSAFAPRPWPFSEGRSEWCWPSRSPSRCNLAASAASSAGGSSRSSSPRAWAIYRAISSNGCKRLKRRFQQDRGRSAAPEAARTILSGSGQVKNRRIQVKLLKSCGNMRMAGASPGSVGASQYQGGSVPAGMVVSCAVMRP